MGIRRAVLCLLLAFYLLPISSCPAEEESPCGVFSWKRSALTDPDFFAVLKAAGVDQAYQMFSSTLDYDTVLAFMADAEDAGVALYALAGEPDWVLESYGESVLESLDQIARYNRVAQSGRIRGLVLDAEPYLLAAWDRGRSAELMAAYLHIVRIGYERAQELALEFILCIPFFYDDNGFEEPLRTLISQHCTGVAIMNYFKKDEAGQIATEVAYARQADVPVIQIYELQAPGLHGLQESNTYHQQGLQGVHESFARMQQTVHAPGLSYALHEYKALKELMGYE